MEEPLDQEIYNGNPIQLIMRMTAGRGIIHAEMPVGNKPGKGLQLWVNLPKSQKMVEPRYQELLNADIPRARIEGVTVKVIAGESLGVEAKVRTYTPILYVDVDMEPNRAFTQDIPEDYTGFVYVLQGNALFGTNETVGKPHSTLVLGNDGAKLTVRSMSEAARFVVIAGKPIKEPIVQHGPFVMNNQKEIYEAIMDYQTCQNGFEASATWQSEIKNRGIRK
jgi:redox-sensitive bicupin YhaK (pirin superfamily)